MLRLLVCIALVVPVTSFIDRALLGQLSGRPLFTPSSRPRIEPRTALIAVSALVLYILAALRFADAPWLELFVYLALFAVLLLLSAIDAVEYRLPDVIVLPSTAVGAFAIVIVSAIEGTTDRIVPALLGAAVAFGVLLVAHLISPRGMGFGDVKLAALLGLAVGWQATTVVDALVLVLWLLLLGFGVGSVAGVVLWVVRRGNRPFPFGPFLALGTVLTVLLSDSLVS